MDRPPVAPETGRGSLAEIEKQRAAVLVALDKLHAHEVPASGSRPILRLVHPPMAVVDHDPVGAGLRVFITCRGWDLFALGGQLELFAAVRAVMRARPERQTWNRTVLAALWSCVGIDGRAA
jgi:hypothetical protein